MKIHDDLLPRLYRAINREPSARELALRLNNEKRPYDEVIVRCVEGMAGEMAGLRTSLNSVLSKVPKTLSTEHANRMASYLERIAAVIERAPAAWTSAVEYSQTDAPNLFEELVGMLEALADENERLRAAQEGPVPGLNTWTELVQIPVLISRLGEVGMDPVVLDRRLMPAIPLSLLELAKALGEVAVDAAHYVRLDYPTPSERPPVRYTVPRGDGFESDDDLEK